MKTLIKLFFLIVLLHVFLTGCSDTSESDASEDELETAIVTTDNTATTAPVIAEVTAVTTPTNDTTPDYTFSSTEAGTITYGGSCSSGTTSATTDNNTITFSTLDNGTYSNCTIKVTDSAVNVSNTLAITDFTVTYWQLIARQVDGDDNGSFSDDELFNTNAYNTFLENEGDNSSNTFMSIGDLTPSDFVSDEKYKFKLEWDGMTVASSGINKEVIWTQTSWLTSSTITDFEEIGNAGFGVNDPSLNNNFVGLGKSGHSSLCVLDGNGNIGGTWSCVGAFRNPFAGVSAPLQKVASSMHLYIWKP